MQPVEREQLKSDFLDYLYAKSGRTSGLYTGLWDEHCRTMGELTRLHWLRSFARANRLTTPPTPYPLTPGLSAFTRPLHKAARPPLPSFYKSTGILTYPSRSLCVTC